MNLREMHNQQIFHKENLHYTEENQMLLHVIDFAKMGLKGVFFLNGAAAISILALFTNVVIQKPYLSIGIFWATACFALGAFFASLGTMFAYFSQGWYQNSSSSYNSINKNNLLLNQSNEAISEYKKEFNGKNLNQDFNTAKKPYLDAINDYQKVLEKQIIDLNIDAKKEDKYGNCWRLGAIVTILISYICFFCGIFMTYNTLSTNYQHLAQISYSDSTYPNVQITSMP